ncbi:hypothetical protein [Lactobacillus kimbladii]|uniref:hypothetical protein n=1 Tax=Lactobacillus kimbladii TaxID=1218506 RepID=UPI00069841A1|nr:hypothetical protein [Lactobacillus kimbladii]
MSALINRHGLAILDQPFTTYTSDFKEQALKQIIVDHEPANQISIDLKKKDKDRDNREIMTEIKAIYEEHTMAIAALLQSLGVTVY